MNSESIFKESASPSHSENKNSGTGVFECNICFDLAQDPIVTLCGHLFCWPCIYKWLQFHSYSHECPVCKSLVKEDNLVPIYGRGTSNLDPRDHPLARDGIPSRPASHRPQTASPLDLTYFRQDGAPRGIMPTATQRLGNLTTTNLFGAIPSLFNFHGAPRGVREPYMFSSYAHGGYPYGLHHYLIHGRQRAKSFFLKTCFLFLGLLVVLLLILPSPF